MLSDNLVKNFLANSNKTWDEIAFYIRNILHGSMNNFKKARYYSDNRPNSNLNPSSNPNLRPLILTFES